MDWTKGKLAEGLRYYDAGEYFAAHEAWESVWLEAQGDDKMFLQGVIQVAAALHHHCRNNSQGTVLLLQAALRRLKPRAACFGGISVALLCSDVSRCLEELKTEKSATSLLPPRIRPLQ